MSYSRQRHADQARAEAAVAREYRNHLLLEEHRNRPKINTKVLLHYLGCMPAEIRSLIVEHYLRDNVYLPHVRTREAKCRIRWLLRVSYLFGYDPCAHQLMRAGKMVEADARERSVSLPRNVVYSGTGRRWDVAEKVGPFGTRTVWRWSIEESGEGGIDLISQRKMRAVEVANKKVMRQKLRVERKGNVGHSDHAMELEREASIDALVALTLSSTT